MPGSLDFIVDLQDKLKQQKMEYFLVVATNKDNPYLDANILTLDGAIALRGVCAQYIRQFDTAIDRMTNEKMLKEPKRQK